MVGESSCPRSGSTSRVVKAVDFYELVASRAEWLPFIGDSDAIVAAAARMIDAS
jgi:hypothetical protein